jgi:hypothetical protein
MKGEKKDRKRAVAHTNWPGELFDQHRHQRLPTRARGQRVPTAEFDPSFFQCFVYWLVVEARSTGVGVLSTYYLPAPEPIFEWQRWL